MAELPLRDRVGNVLVDIRFTAESELASFDDRSMPLSLVVVGLADAVLMMLNGLRGYWELPGGLREPGESPRQAAIRELAEETGIRTTALDLAAVVEFELVRPARHEYAAVYRTDLKAVPRLVVNDEASDFQWWIPHTPPAVDMSPIDAEIGRRVLELS
ncbi:NUDIX hydrolase [Saccharopolyspora phatthalungensis]|uniref:8-oxo-dGTP pyrophosphatase MutT (NUDIX family) n=1 Tax=Saccharopolyspora phatthalungensis TaxID=664693 RepID=A0A840QAJ5_9PSEU|nr:NUDIX hydrolase [Saccharopolyspora phatthalungensis]MBB5156781.1 8-oxo-dGTP pyrophosphatase MutT (NUDIX family) [Saccharopolyspora phatthalungensis]